METTDTKQKRGRKSRFRVPLHVNGFKAEAASVRAFQVACDKRGIKQAEGLRKAIVLFTKESEKSCKKTD